MVWCLRLGTSNAGGVGLIPGQRTKIQHAVIVSSLSHVQLFVIPWTAARQAPLSMEFSMQEYWSGLPFPPPGDLPDPGIEPTSLMSPALAGGLFSPGATWEARCED